jgi:hypothetical protein
MKRRADEFEDRPESAATDTPVADEEEEIRTLAYQYWEERAGEGGSAEEDWLRAEREIRTRRSRANE